MLYKEKVKVQICTCKRKRTAVCITAKWRNTEETTLNHRWLSIVKSNHPQISVKQVYLCLHSTWQIGMYVLRLCSIHFLINTYHTGHIFPILTQFFMDICVVMCCSAHINPCYFHATTHGFVSTGCHFPFCTMPRLYFWLAIIVCTSLHVRVQFCYSMIFLTIHSDSTTKWQTSL